MENESLCRIYSATCLGLNAIITTIEVSITQGVGIHLIGLPDNAVKESLLRVTTALQRAGYRIPGRKIVINLAPADLKKEGSCYDAAIAICLLYASGQLSSENAGDYLIMGEIALNGEIRPVKGVLPVALKARNDGFKACIFPKDSAAEASEIDGIAIYGTERLQDIISILDGDGKDCRLLVRPEKGGNSRPYVPEADFRDVKGQEFAKRGLEIAAAGNHNLIMTGPPGSGKSLMAKCLAGILPPMSREEALETSMIYSVAGQSAGFSGLMKERPFRTPHHTASTVSLVGGGSNAIPGEISLAHNGVLYLDEMPQYPRHVLDILRQPIEDRRISISRARYKIDYPASFMLVGSMNPCPCGYAGEDDGRCNCTPGMILRYQSRISGPLLDRIDLHLKIRKVDTEKLVDSQKAESSASIAARVVKAREIQLKRFAAYKGFYTNSQMTPQMLADYCPLDNACRQFLNNFINAHSLSARTYSRILKISRTVADLDGSKDIRMKHICEAIQYRFRT